MRFLLFKALLLFILLTPVTACADTEMYGTNLTLPGETAYNEAVENAMTGSLALNPVALLSSVTDDALGEIRECASEALILLILAAISGIITTVSQSMQSKGAGEAAFFACFALMSAVAVRCFGVAFSYGADVTRSMTDFITKLSPLLMLTVAAGGGTVSAAAFQPVLSGAVYIVSLVTEKCLMPLAAYGAVLSVAGNINGDLQLTHFIKLVKSVAKWIMTAVITIFTGVTAVYGLSAPSLDAVGGKAVKFAVGSLVPVVGGFLSDTLETVVSGTRLMKNSVGTAGIITMCAVCLLPVIKIGVIELMLKAVSAAAEPLTDKRISKMMWEVSEAVTTVFAIVVMTAVMFIINISIIISVTNVGV